MLKTILFAVYAAAIPAVPLYGTIHFKKEKEKNKRLACWCLFAVQSLISLTSIISYIGRS